MSDDYNWDDALRELEEESKEWDKNLPNRVRELLAQNVKLKEILVSRNNYISQIEKDYKFLRQSILEMETIISDRNNEKLLKVIKVIKRGIYTNS